MRKSRFSIVVVLCVMLVAVLIPVSVFAGTPNKCPKCFNKYKIYYTICDYPKYTTTKVTSYKMWIPVGSPIYNGGKNTDTIYIGKGKSTTVKYEGSGTFSYGNLSIGAKYTKEKTKTVSFSVPVKLKPKYYGQMYIATDVDKYKCVCNHDLRCFKCGYVYKKNYKTESGYRAFPLKNQAVEYKTKTSKNKSDVLYKEVSYNYCKGKKK